jgi:2-oxoisovalerate dehydrogenase E1 component beta subunit
LKLVAPSTPYDAKGLIKAAIRDPNPVLYFEHKRLYRHVKGEVPDNDYVVEIGKGDVKRQGNDITVVAYGSTVHLALEAAEILERQDGVSVEVVDLRSLMPLDKELIISSVKKTGKVLITHEDTVTGGIGGEIAALIAEFAFESLDAPIKRVGAIDIPTPFAPTLEEYFLPNKEKVLAALRELAAY